MSAPSSKALAPAITGCAARAGVRPGVVTLWVLALVIFGPSATAAPAGDADGDGVVNGVEDRNGNGNPDDDDTDNDDTADWLDVDDDGDNVDTIDEDSDGDGDPTDDLDDPEDERPNYLNPYWPRDRDHDGFQAEPWGEDCADDNIGINPDVANDPYYDGADWDCDGNAFEFDFDGDGYDSSDVHRDDGSLGDDCNDRNADIHPGAEEDLEDGDAPRVDRDCDGYTDPVGSLVGRGGCDCANGPIGTGATTPALGAVLAFAALASRRSSTARGRAS